MIQAQRAYHYAVTDGPASLGPSYGLHKCLASEDGDKLIRFPLQATSRRMGQAQRAHHSASSRNVIPDR